MEAHSSILAWEILWAAIHGAAKSRTQLRDSVTTQPFFPRLEGLEGFCGFIAKKRDSKSLSRTTFRKYMQPMRHLYVFRCAFPFHLK